jgi:hypothetical protein
MYRPSKRLLGVGAMLQWTISIIAISEVKAIAVPRKGMAM